MKLKVVFCLIACIPVGVLFGLHKKQKSMLLKKIFVPREQFRTLRSQVHARESSLIAQNFETKEATHVESVSDDQVCAQESSSTVRSLEEEGRDQASGKRLYIINGEIFFDRTYVGECRNNMTNDDLCTAIKETKFFDFEFLLKKKVMNNEEKIMIHNFLQSRITDKKKFLPMVVAFQGLFYTNKEKIGEIALASALMCTEYGQWMKKEKREKKLSKNQTERKLIASIPSNIFDISNEGTDDNVEN
jgi:hypothetical protein